jgi:hypothetical protein
MDEISKIYPIRLTIFHNALFVTVIDHNLTMLPDGELTHICYASLTKRGGAGSREASQSWLFMEFYS